MSRAPLIATSVLVGAALGAVVVAALPSERVSELELKVADLEDDLVLARRDASDFERVAAAERERKRIAEEETQRLRIAVQNLPPPAPPEDGGTGPGGHGGRAPGVARERPVLAPADWDGARLRIEVERLSMRGRRMATSPLLDACATAAKAQGDPARTMLVDTLREAGLPARLRLAATMILERLGDQRAVPDLLAALPTASDWAQRRAILRALANLPGDAQTPTFVDIWNDEDGDARFRMVAANALARRAHPIAVGIVDGSVPVTDQALRARAIDSLHGYAREDAYRRTDLIPAFGKALMSAAGEGQVRVALLALEGYWRPECVPYLSALADAQNVAAEITDRGRSAADAITAGEQRPEYAGLPKNQAPDEQPAAPGEGD